jgi:hypothetical protein
LPGTAAACHRVCAFPSVGTTHQAHYFAAFTLIAEALVLFVALPKERARLIVGSLAAAAAFAPLWSLFRAQSSATGRTAFITARPLSVRLDDVVRQFAMGTNVPASWLEGAGIAAAGIALVSRLGV